MKAYCSLFFRVRHFSLAAVVSSTKANKNAVPERSAAKHPLLKAFFGPFQDFTREPQKPPETEFRRLQEEMRWGRSSAVYRAARRAFLMALVDETKSPVHKYFVDGHKDFIEYNCSSSPRYEFHRLRTLKSWKTKDAEQEYTAYQRAFEEEFHGKIDLFFSQYRDFPYNPRKNAMREFRLLVKYKGWKVVSKRNQMHNPHNKRDEKDESSYRYEAAREGFFEAFREEFGDTFGAGRENLKTWQKLCEVLGVNPIPKDEESCRTRLRPLHVNIYDLMQHMRSGDAYDFFPNLPSLSEYSYDNHLIYPLREAKEGPFKFLLRKISEAQP